MHLVEPTDGSRGKSAYRALGPAMAFRQQRHCKEDRCGGGGKSGADVGVSV
jgi:hypothetical protein